MKTRISLVHLVGLGAAILLAGAIDAAAQLPTCYTTPPTLNVASTLVRDPSFDVSPQIFCGFCTTPCTGSNFCYDCWDTDGIGGVDYCCYNYQGDSAYESCGVNLDWYANSSPFHAGFSSLDLRVSTPLGAEGRLYCKPIAQACTPASSESHCTVGHFTFHPSVITGWLQKDFQLYAVSDCASTEPFRKRLVGETRLRYKSPQGSITASPNPCIHDKETMGGVPYCTTNVTWETTEPALPYVIIYVRDEGSPPQWSPPLPWRCVEASSTPTTDDAPGIWITDEEGVTFELWPRANCTAPFTYPSSGSPLDTVTVTTEPEGTVMCKLDNQPMRQGVEIGVNSLGIVSSCLASPNLGACYEAVAEKLAAIGVKYHRISINWNALYPGASCANPPPQTLNFNRYDPILQAFDDAGIEPWLILNQSPCWYSSKPSPFPTGCTDHPEGTYPPDPANSTAWAAWLDYVTQVYQRYGPGGILDLPARNWEVWNEPVGFQLNIDPVSCPPGNPEGQNSNQSLRYDAWEPLQRSVWDVITAAEGDPPSVSTVWSANLVYTQDATEAAYGPSWIDPQIDTIGGDEMFDGFNLHAFQRDFSNTTNPNRPSTIESTVQQVKYSRARVDAAGATSMPMAITEVSWHPMTDPWNFLRELPDGAHRAQFLKDSMACLANAGGDKLLWFNATDYGYECASPSPVPCVDIETDPNCVGWGLGLLTVDPDVVAVEETPLYCAFADLCRHLDGCTVEAGVCE